MIYGVRTQRGDFHGSDRLGPSLRSLLRPPRLFLRYPFQPTHRVDPVGIHWVGLALHPGVLAATPVDFDVIGAAPALQFGTSVVCSSHDAWAQEKQAEPAWHTAMRFTVHGRDILHTSTLPSRKHRSFLAKASHTPPSTASSCSFVS